VNKCLPSMLNQTHGPSSAMRMLGSYGKKAQHHTRWIDMPRECKFGDPGNTKPCLSPKCAMCSLLQASYNPHIFGCGILTTSLPKYRIFVLLFFPPILMKFSIGQLNLLLTVTSRGELRRLRCSQRLTLVKWLNFLTTTSEKLLHLRVLMRWVIFIFETGAI